MNKQILGLDFRVEPSKKIRIALICILLVLCYAILMKNQIANGFTILWGDRYDGVISTVILEHWYLFFLGKAHWSEVNYLYPYTLTIANTDAYFLNGLSYIPFRLLGLDPFISAYLSALIIKTIGFIGTYLLCRKLFSISFYWALLAAVIFTISNGMTIHSSRLQLATVALFPVMALLLFSMIQAFMEGHSAKFRRIGVTTGILFGAWCMTCFYMAWFFTFFSMALVIIILIKSQPGTLSRATVKFKNQYGSVLIVIGVTAVSLAPFLYAFISKSRETGVRIYEEAHAWTVPLQGIIQVGKENILFGGIYNSLLKYFFPSYVPAADYYNTGFPVIVFWLFLAGCALAFNRSRKTGSDVIFTATVAATIFTWMLTLNIHGHSAWFFVFHAIPGAKALRVVTTYQLFLALPVVIIAAKYLSTRQLGMPIALLLAGLMVAEELNNPTEDLNRQAEINRIALPNPPPEICKVFYTSGWVEQDQVNSVGNIYAHNVSAMLLAQIAKIPTINGIASFNPPDWDFSNPNNKDYENRVFIYSKNHNITDLCKLDLNTKEWTAINDQVIKNTFVSVPFFKESAWAGNISRVQGFSPYEAWGAWSSGDTVTFEFDRPLPQNFIVHLVANAFGPNTKKLFNIYVGDNQASFKLAGGPEERLLSLENPENSKTLKIIVPAPTSPKQLGTSVDDRRLGIGIYEISIEPVTSAP